MLNVSLLGGSSFFIDGAVVRSDLGPAGRLLACYLFEFIGRVHRRERLADLFWAELEPDKSRSALNTALWRIRKLLELGTKGGGHHLITVGEAVLLELPSSMKVDTHILENASRRIESCLKQAGLTETDEVEAAAALNQYKGPFLDGDDGDWILQERERLHCLYVKSTLELMRFAARCRQHERALEYGRKILVLDPLRESVQRDVMLLLVSNGQRAEAIRAYQHLKSVLKSDLDIEPMPDTTRLYQEIISGEVFERLESYQLMHFGAPLLEVNTHRNPRSPHSMSL